MLNESSIHGVELDTITGGIAQMLYPSAKVEISGFEEANVPDNFYDLAISNVPFGNYQVHDINLNSYGFAIHNYFVRKRSRGRKYTDLDMIVCYVYMIAFILFSFYFKYIANL